MHAPTALIALWAATLAMSNPLASRQAQDTQTDIVFYASGDCQGSIVDTIDIGGNDACYGTVAQAASASVTVMPSPDAQAGTYVADLVFFSDRVCTAQGQAGRTLSGQGSQCYNLDINGVSVMTSFTPS